MKIGQYCQRQRCKHVELEQFLAGFRVARVCQRQLGFLVLILSYVLCLFGLLSGIFLHYSSRLRLQYSKYSRAELFLCASLALLSLAALFLHLQPTGYFTLLL